MDGGGVFQPARQAEDGGLERVGLLQQPGRAGHAPLRPGDGQLIGMVRVVHEQVVYREHHAKPP